MVDQQPSDRAASAPNPPEDRYADLRAELERCVARVCPRWLADRRQDLVQVAILRVMALEERGEGNRDLSASYLKRVAYSALVDEIRRVRRRGEVPLAIESKDGGMASVAPDPERAALGREIGHNIMECLERLVRPRRLAVVLYLQGHNVPQASRLLGWARKRTENLVYRGLADLRGCLEERGWTA